MTGTLRVNYSKLSFIRALPAQLHIILVEGPSGRMHMSRIRTRYMGVTHGNVNVYAYVTCGQVSVKRLYDMCKSYTYVTRVH